jgi:hypothetical protein
VWLITAGVVLLLVLAVAVWVALTGAGWSLVSLGGGRTVVASDTGRPAGVLDTVYSVGFTISTLDVGDFTAAGPAWRLLTTLASSTGLVLVTLGITYLLAVVSAVVSPRSPPVHISAPGHTAAAVVAGG